MVFVTYYVIQTYFRVNEQVTIGETARHREF